MTDNGARREYRFSRIFNFRDVGGVPTGDGLVVRPGRLFRSDSLSGLRDEDREAFGALGIRTVLDLRRPYEVEAAGRVPDWDGFGYRHIHPEHEEWRRWDREGTLAGYLSDRYMDLAETGAAGLGQAIALIADERNAPVAVHCVAGKDRTGVVCALTLCALGVSDGDVADDYTLSTAGMRRYVEWARVELPEPSDGHWSPLESPAEAMTSFLSRLRGRFGSIEGYLKQAGVDGSQLEALRAHMLAGPAGAAD